MSIQERLLAAMAQAPGGPIKPIRLAQLSGVTRSAVTLMLNGTTKTLRSENATNFARILNVRAEWLVDGKGPMRPQLVDTFSAVSESTPAYAAITQNTRATGLSTEAHQNMTRIESAVMAANGALDKLLGKLALIFSTADRQSSEKPSNGTAGLISLIEIVGSSLTSDQIQALSHLVLSMIGDERKSEVTARK